MARLVVAVECDFEGYRPFTHNRCDYNHVRSIESIHRVADLVQNECSGRAVFLIHTSPFIRRNWNDIFFTSPDYFSIWKRIEAQGGEVGLHIHEEEPDGSCLYYGYPSHLRKVISSHVQMLVEAGLKPICESTGYHGLNEWFVPILEENGLVVNLDNVGSFTEYTVRDWTETSGRPYFLNPDRVVEAGTSKILSLPLGMLDFCRGDDGLTCRNSLRYLQDLWNHINDSFPASHVCYLRVQAHRIDADQKKLQSFIRRIRQQGIEIITPSQAYQEAISAVSGSDNRGMICES